MVEVVELWRGQKGQVVPAVGNGGTDQRQAVPHARAGHVRAQQHRPHHHWQQVGELMEQQTMDGGLMPFCDSSSFSLCLLVTQ